MEAGTKTCQLVALVANKGDPEMVKSCAQDNYFIPNWSSYGEEASFQFTIPLCCAKRTVVNTVKNL